MIEDPPPGPRLLPTDIVSTTTMVKSWIWGQERLKTYITASNSSLIDYSRIFQESFIVSQSFLSCLSFVKRSSNQILFCQKLSHQMIKERSIFPFSILRRASTVADQLAPNTPLRQISHCGIVSVLSAWKVYFVFGTAYLVFETVQLMLLVRVRVCHSMLQHCQRHNGPRVLTL